MVFQETTDQEQNTEQESYIEETEAAQVDLQAESQVNAAQGEIHDEVEDQAADGPPELEEMEELAACASQVRIPTEID